MVESDRIVAGAWLPLDGEPAARDELVLAVARRRGDEPAAVAREFERVAERFDVDAVYVAPASGSSAADAGSDSDSESDSDSDSDPGSP